MSSISDTMPIPSSMLYQIVMDSETFLRERKTIIPLSGMRALASMQRRPYDLSSRLRQVNGVALIAQVKRSAPDMDVTLENFQPMPLATRFTHLGAHALMVATNEKYYHGSIVDLIHINQSVDIPLIRQDFIFDEYQIVEARAAGADAIVLIAGLVQGEELRNLISVAQRNRMTAIVQVQDKKEIKEALQFEPRVIAISNRDMNTFEVNLENTLRLREFIPPHMVVVSMGGLRTAEDVATVQKAGVDAIIVGQALLTAPDAGMAIQELLKLTETT